MRARKSEVHSGNNKVVVGAEIWKALIIAAGHLDSCLVRQFDQCPFCDLCRGIVKEAKDEVPHLGFAI